MNNTLFTSESVTEGHPDKICDQISDAILDNILKQDESARVACEVLIASNVVVVAGEISTTAYIDIENIVREKIAQIGYIDKSIGFDYQTCDVFIKLNKQSADISQGVTLSKTEIGAGDQGMVFGFACNETKVLLPMPIVLAHKITQTLAQVRKNNVLTYLRPDGKAQVTVEYKNDRPFRVDTVVVSTQHNENVTQETIKKDIFQYVIHPSIPTHLLDENTKYYINPTGRFVLGGPHGDCGLTGRKIIVDTYGGYTSHGGGAFSGKDPTKIDRSAAYMARYVAKNIVGANLATICEIQLAYAIGIAKPVSILVDTKNTGIISDKQIEQLIKKYFDLRPIAMIEKLQLQKPIYEQTATYGHFGRNDLNLPWECLDMVNTLKQAVLIRYKKASSF